LLNRFQRKKLNIAGFSIGGSIALMAASKNPEFFSSVVTVGADLWMSETNRSAFDFAMKQAIASQNQTAIKELSTLANKPIMTPGQFQMRAKWLTDFGGIYRKMTYNKLVLKTIKNMLLSKEYSFADILKSIRGIDYVQQCMLPGLNDLNLFNEINMIKVPWYLFQGAHDPLVPLALTEKFFINIKADKKEIIVFHDSSHMPHYEQPLRFREALLHAIHASV
jgi:pimeloyl-ACP methyl ester carboxylesterase